MRYVALFTLLLVIAASGCKDKKSDVALFTDGPVRISLSSDIQRGYASLQVAFSAYLETKDSVFTDEISEVKWLITGPRGYRQEIVQESYNYQNEDDNKEDFFYWDYQFHVPGKYKVQLVLNKGEYRSNMVPVDVWVRPDESRGIR